MAISDPKLLRAVLSAQRTEATEARIYETLATLSKNEQNAQVLARISKEELAHAAFWQTKTGVEVEPSRFKTVRRVLLARLLGLTFVLKQMEKREGTGSAAYRRLAGSFPETAQISEDEARHERELIGMLDEGWLAYVGSIVLGLNDALVELTGALAGYTLALSDSRVISVAGLVTGISATFSMAASEYLSSRAEGNVKATRSALYTGGAYLVTVALLILPFLLLSSRFVSLGITLAIAVLIIFCFNYYLAVAKELNFKKRFVEMAGISLGVAALSFLIGWALKVLLGVDA